MPPGDALGKNAESRARPARETAAGGLLAAAARPPVGRSVLAAPAAVGHGSANGYTVYT